MHTCEWEQTQSLAVICLHPRPTEIPEHLQPHLCAIRALGHLRPPREPASHGPIDPPVP